MDYSCQILSDIAVSDDRYLLTIKKISIIRHKNAKITVVYFVLQVFDIFAEPDTRRF